MDSKKAQEDIISTLTTKNGWLSDDDDPLYLYKGFWYYKNFVRGAVAAQSGELSFEPSPSDIVLASIPKSGTTWLKALAFSITTRARFPPSDPNNPLYLKSPHGLIPYMEDDGGASEPRDFDLIATHLPYTALPASVWASGCKIVYIWRDPKDAFISLWHFCGKLIRANKESTEPIPLQDAFELFCDGVSPYGPYWDHVLGYRKALQDHPGSVLLLKYEDMMDDIETQVKRLAEFMGCPFSPEEEEGGVVAEIIELCSFQKLSNLEVNKGGVRRTRGNFAFSKDMYFRKAQVGDWANYLTVDMAAKIDEISIANLGLA